jgi:hypothetical protein
MLGCMQRSWTWGTYDVEAALSQAAGRHGTRMNSVFAAIVLTPRITSAACRSSQKRKIERTQIPRRDCVSPDGHGKSAGRDVGGNR